MSIAKRLIALIALSTAAVAANATIITYTDSVNPNPDIKLSANGEAGTVKSYTFTHDITDNGFLFNQQVLQSATLTVYLIDNVTKGSETFSFKIGQGNFAEIYDQNNPNSLPNGNTETGYPFTLQASLSDLAADGKLSVTLNTVSGDFIFTHSELVADAEVPEPASLALLGFGLGAIGLLRRRKA